MKPSTVRRTSGLLALFTVSLFLPFTLTAGPIIADHTAASAFHSIPLSAIAHTKSSLHIAYGHSSHGQQIIEGMRNLDAFMTGNGSPSGTYAVDFTGNAISGVLDFRDNCNYYYYENPPRPFPNAKDLGALWDNTESYTAWAIDTRNYLSIHPEVNVIIWSWCGQASYNGPEGPTHVTTAIKEYLVGMAQLELDFPMVKFVYMTGHADGYPGYSALRANNDSIKQFCSLNNKVLFDFENIESWDPDGNYYGDKHVTGGCNWDANGNGVTEETREDTTGWKPATPLHGDRNWALDWQNSHSMNVDWYECNINNYHTQHLNDNRKAYAFWWLMSKLAGWDGSTEVEEYSTNTPCTFDISQNYPNPFNPSTKIQFAVPSDGHVRIRVYNCIGQIVATPFEGEAKAGQYRTVQIDGTSLSSGVYFYCIEHRGQRIAKQMVLIK